ncbi:MAG: hypothetical protein RLY58_1141 [Pseudomonadota bacterium]|jgi:rhodanese-related sulfurtransferase
MVKRVQHPRWGVAAVLVFSLSSSGCMVHSARPLAERPSTWALPVHQMVTLNNVYQVDAHVYRAEQPSAQALAQLMAGQILTASGQPFATVVSLRTTLTDRVLNTPDSQVKLVELPLDTWDVSNAQVLAFLRVATDPKRQPLLVHCRHGADRTGTMVAAYRMVVQGWSADAALAEMKEGGFGYHPVWVNLVHRIRHLPVEQMRRDLQLPTVVQATSVIAP